MSPAPLSTASNPDQKTSPQTSLLRSVSRLAQESQGARTATRRLLGTVCPTPCDKRCHSAIPDSPDWSMDLAGRGLRSSRQAWLRC
jgi:hypothetical protein